MAATGKRTRNIVKNQISSTSNQTIKLNSIYIGYVKDNSDAMKMRRLRVWIPELSPDKINGLYTVNWCSPFAGATPIAENNKTNTSQTSYGMWFSPPDIDNEVVVMFANGDPNRGIYIGGLYQQNMNHMVPGIPSSTLSDPNSLSGDSGPSQEYNKKSSSISSDADKIRPGFSQLTDALLNQGLSGDSIRGTSTSGARRDDKSKVSGILTPGGNQFVLDDDDDHSFIRLRTAGGTQIIISDTVGMIYMVTKSGNSWLELSDDGIEAYTTGNYSIRSHGDFNVHSDGNINLFSGKYTNIVSNQGLSFSSVESFNLIAGNKISMASGGQLSIITTADLSLSGSGDIGIDAGGTLALRACSQIGMTACDKIEFKASKINQNTSTPSTPVQPQQPNVVSATKTQDRTVTAGGTGQSTQTSTIVSTLPTHEPYLGHPTSNTGPATIIPDKSITTIPTTPAPVNTDATNDSSSTSSSTNNKSTKWMYPITGTVLKNTEGNKDVYVSTIYGQSIVSPYSGTVLFSGEPPALSPYYTATSSGDSNYTVAIDHGNGLNSLFVCLSSTSISKGDKVIKGQTIGQAGNVKGTPIVLYSITYKGDNIDVTTKLPKMVEGTNIIAGEISKI